MRLWLINEVLPHEYRPVYLQQLVYQRLRRDSIEPPTKNRVERLVLVAVNRHKKAFFTQTYGRLSPTVCANLRQLIYPIAGKDDELAMDEEETSDPTHHYLLHDLKIGAGEPKVSNIKKVAARLTLLQGIDLPTDLFADIPLPFLQQYQRQVAVESISHLQRREGKDPQKAQLYTMLATFCWVRQRKITDYLAELFIRILNDIRLRAKSRVEKRLITDYIKVGGKQQLLFRLAQAMLDHPAGIIANVYCNHYVRWGESSLRFLESRGESKGSSPVRWGAVGNTGYAVRWPPIRLIYPQCWAEKGNTVTSPLAHD